MSVITTTKSGLKIEKCGGKYIATKGKQYAVYDSLAALSRDLASNAAAKPKKHKAKKAAKKPKTHRPKRYTLAEARAVIGTPVKHKVKKTHKKSKGKKGHKKTKKGGKKSKKRTQRRQPQYTYGIGMPEVPRVPRGRPRGQRRTPEVYHGDVGRFDRPRPPASGYSYPRGYLPPGA